MKVWAKASHQPNTNSHIFESIEAAAQFWDTHSLADYWDQIHEVEIGVAAKRRRRVAIDPAMWEQVVVRARFKGKASPVK